MKNTISIKIIAAILAIAMIIPIAGCGGSDYNADSNSDIIISDDTIDGSATSDIETDDDIEDADDAGSVDYVMDPEAAVETDDNDPSDGGTDDGDSDQATLDDLWNSISKGRDTSKYHIYGDGSKGNGSMFANVANVKHIEGKTVTLPKSAKASKLSGETIHSNSYGVIDVTHANEGYVTLKLTKSTSKNVKGAVDYTDADGKTTYFDWYMDKDKEYDIPMYYGSGKYAVSIMENIEGTKYSVKLSVSITAKVADEFAPFLHSSMYADYAGSKNAAAKAKELTKDCKTYQEKINEIYNWVFDSIEYDKPFIDAKRDNIEKSTGKGGQPAVIYDLDVIMSEAKGVCGDRAALMAAMLRSIGIPCKYVSGTASGNAHAWISVWNETGTYEKNGTTYTTGAWVELDTISRAIQSNVITKYYN